MKLIQELTQPANKNFEVAVRYDGSKTHVFKVMGVKDAIHARQALKQRADYKELSKPEIQKAVEIKEALENEDGDPEEPRVIAKGGDFQVLLLSDDQVMLQNIKAGKDIVKMPFIIWKQLSRSL